MAFPQIIDPNSPAGTDSPRLGDDQIRALKQFLSDLFTLPTAPLTISATIGSVSTAGKLTLTNALWNGDVVTPAYGGTGLASYAVGDLLYASGATTLAKLSLAAKGSLIVGNGTTVATLAVGPNTNVLTADSTQATGLKWAAGGGGSTITSAVATVATNESTASITYVDLTTVGPSVTITPGPSGIVLVHISANMQQTSSKVAFVSFVSTGGNTIAASDTRALIFTGNAASLANRATAIVYLTGQAAVSTSYKFQYKTSDTSFPSTFQDREISVMTW